jgi:glutamine amidotransferase
MCELFALSSRHATTITFSLHEFAMHGGITAPHTDGWGLALYDDGDVRLMREPEPASDSRWVGMIEKSGLHSRIAMSHIRLATQGDVTLRNTQPFARELGGRIHTFAHNGMLPGAEHQYAGSLQRYRPIGTTDSEIIFCALLERLASIWENARIPTMEERAGAIAMFAGELRGLGPANFVYSDGDCVFAHGHRRTQIGGAIEPPGLHRLRRSCAENAEGFHAAGVALGRCTEAQEVALFASVPLTAENWIPLDEGELVVARDGEIVAKY